jgi:hypothetical protein
LLGHSALGLFRPLSVQPVRHFAITAFRQSSFARLRSPHLKQLYRIIYENNRTIFRRAFAVPSAELQAFRVAPRAFALQRPQAIPYFKDPCAVL